MKFYSFLQALALNEETPDKIEDFLQPDMEGLLQKVEVFDRFNEYFCEVVEESGFRVGYGIDWVSIREGK